jgi:Flp pilus assembly protein TadG
MRILALLKMVSFFDRRRVTPGLRRAGPEAGGSLIEIALVFPLLMLLLFGMVDLGRGVYLAIEVSSAAHAGAQYGSLSLTNAGNTNAIKLAAQADVPDIPAAQLTVTSSPTSGATSSCWCPSAPGTIVACGVYPANPCSGTGGSQIVLLQVTTQYTYHPWIPYPPFTKAINITGHAQMPTGQY